MKYTEQRLNESTAHGYLVRKRQALKRLVLEAVRLEDALGEALLELLARAVSYTIYSISGIASNPGCCSSLQY